MKDRIQGLARKEQPEPQPNVTPEEQQQYDMFMGKLREAAYGKAFKSVVERVKSAQDPAEGLAFIAANIVRRVEDSAVKNGVPISSDVMMAAGVELIEDLGDAMEAIGIATFTPDQLEGAYYRALDIYREQAQKEGRLDQKSFQEDWQGVREAEASGQIEQLMPGAVEKFGGMS